MASTWDARDQETDDLKKGLLVSLGAHVFVVLFFTVKMVFFPGEPINYQAAIRVDLVALPDKVEKPKAAPVLEPPPAPKPEPVAEKTPPPAPPKEKAINKDLQKKALSRLKAMEALERIKHEAKEERVKEASAKEIKYKGNILSPGTELTGLNRLQHEEYIVNLDRHIKENWTLPEWLARKDYQAQVLLKIDKNGHILSKQLAKSSGNPSYDDIVMQTIDRSAPFPKPPEKFEAILSVNGILIGFPE